MYLSDCLQILRTTHLAVYLCLFVNFDLLLVQNYDLFRRFDTHFVSGADLENYWADYRHIANTWSVMSLVMPFQVFGPWPRSLPSTLTWFIPSVNPTEIFRGISWKTAQDSYTVTINQIIRFQERMHLEKIQFDQIQNGRLSAIFHLDRHDIAEYHENRSR